jgi:hypothetical protein
MLYTQRSRLALRYRGPGGSDRAVSFRRGPMWAAGETGLMSILATRQFARTRQFLTCHGATTARGHDVRVVLWRLKQNARRAVHVRQVLKGCPPPPDDTAAAGCATARKGRCTSAPATPRSPVPRRVCAPAAARCCASAR